MGSVSHFRLAWSARNNPPRSTASDVSAAALVIIAVGTLNHVNDTGVIELVGSVHEPLALKEPDETLVGRELVETGKGKMPIPGIELDDADPLLAEVKLLSGGKGELELDALPVAEFLAEPVWLELEVCTLVVDSVDLKLNKDAVLGKEELDENTMLKFDDEPLEVDWLLILNDERLLE